LMISLISSALIMLSPHQPLTHARELPVETAVENETAHLGDEAAQEIRVHGFFENDLLAELGLQVPGELVLLGSGQRHGRPDLGANPAKGGVGEVLIGGNDGRQVVQAAALGDERHEVLDQLAAPRLLGERESRRAAIPGLDPRPREHVDGLAVGLENVEKAVQLTTRGLPCPGLGGRRVQRFRVAAGGSLLGAHQS